MTVEERTKVKRSKAKGVLMSAVAILMRLSCRLRDLCNARARV